MSQFPTDPKKIKERIRRYERALANEKKKYGDYHDGSGNRHLLGPLYMLVDDVDGALKSFAWFDKEFPDDTGDPFQYLCWCLALFRSGDHKLAAAKLAQTWFKNPYLVARLIKVDQERLDIWHGSNWVEPDYVTYGPIELLDLWDEEAVQWADDLFHQEWFGRLRTRYIEIRRRLKSERVGPERSRLVHELYAMMELEGVELEQ